jgi:hypothetical protein
VAANSPPQGRIVGILLRRCQSGDLTLPRAAVNFSSKSCVVTVGGFEMNALLMVYFSAGVSFAGFGLLKLQARLELWAYQRHAND